MRYLISHRGNLTGRNKEQENHPTYILEALSKGFDVEIDLWWDDASDTYVLGHDEPQWPIKYEFLMRPRFWIHIKNDAALFRLRNNPEIMHSNFKLNYFCHESDRYVVTSSGFLWTAKFNVAPVPMRDPYIIYMDTSEFSDLTKLVENLRNSGFMGVCSDYIQYIDAAL